MPRYMISKKVVCNNYIFVKPGESCYSIAASFPLQNVLKDVFYLANIKYCSNPFVIIPIIIKEDPPKICIDFIEFKVKNGILTALFEV